MTDAARRSTAVQAEPRAVRIVRRIGFPIALMVLVGVAALSYARVKQFREDLEWRGHTHLVLEHIERTQTSLLAADLYRRAYRLSRSKGDFAQIEERISSAARELDLVAELTRDNASQGARIAALRPLIKERITLVYDGIDLPDWELLDAPTREEQHAQQTRGSDLGKRVSAGIDAMRSEEERLLTERSARTLASATATESAILFGGTTGVGLVAIFYASLVVENRRRLAMHGELERSNAVLSGVLDGAHDIIGVKDLAGRYTLINPAGCEAFKRPASEILGRTVGELLTGGTGEAIMEMDARLMKSGETSVVEQTTTMGELTRSYLTTKAPFRDSSGAVIGIISISLDVTERNKVENQVKESLRDQALRDPLTGVFNRRYMDETLTRELSRVVRRERPLSIVMIDLDHFKRLNDAFGHAAGDEVLKSFARLLSGGVRREDVACRYGGEEFALILPEMTLAGALERAEELRSATERLAIDVDGKTIPITGTFGVACFPEHGATGDELLRAADAALYEGKKRGRNCVVAAGG